MTLRRLHAIAERRGGNSNVHPKGFSDDGFTLEPSGNVWNDIKSNNEGNIKKEQTPENEGPFCDQDVVEGPQLPVNVEKYPARIISEDIDLALVTFSGLAPEINVIRARR